jgi:hypothetical protein
MISTIASAGEKNLKKDKYFNKQEQFYYAGKANLLSQKIMKQRRMPASFVKKETKKKSFFNMLGDSFSNPTHIKSPELKYSRKPASVELNLKTLNKDDFILLRDKKKTKFKEPKVKYFNKDYDSLYWRH